MSKTINREPHMHIQDSLKPQSNESPQLTQTRRSKWLLICYGVLLLASGMHFFDTDHWKMRRVAKHIAAIRPQWEAFQRSNPGFAAVELFPRYDEAYGVVFAAKGTVPWSVEMRQLAEFMWSTQPPCSVDTLKVTTDPSTPPWLASPAVEKATVLTADGRRIQVDVAAEPYPGSNLTASGSGAEQPVGPANRSQPIRSKTNSTSSTAGSHR